MGISTKALLRGDISPMQIANDLIELYHGGKNSSDFSIRFTMFNDFHFVDFYQKDMPHFGRDFYGQREWKNQNHRSLAVFGHDEYGSEFTEITSGDRITHISLGCWGDSVEIVETLLRKYGGWIMRNDCSDEWEVFSAI